MYVLKDRKCDICNNYIQVFSFNDEDTDKRFVDSGECTNCGKVDILPQEEYRGFVRDYCINVNIY